MKALDLSGQVFGRLTALYCSGKNKKGNRLWRCLCTCGNEVDVEGYRLKNGHTQSCGCIWTESWDKARTKHGFARRGKKTELYSRWNAMRKRCYQPKNVGYKDYGGRGISICKEWDSFEAFREWAFAHGYKENAGLFIDRIDNNGNYEPSNCRWVTRTENNNNKRNNHRVLFRGELRTIAQVARLTGIGFCTVRDRVYRNWKDEQLALPLGSRIKRVSNI